MVGEYASVCVHNISTGEIIPLILKAVALAMSVATIVLSILNVADIDTYVTLLGIGLFTLAVAALQGVKVD